MNTKVKGFLHNIRALPNVWRKRRERRPPEPPASYGEYLNLQVGDGNEGI